MHGRISTLLRRRSVRSVSVTAEADPDVVGRETEAMLVAALEETDDPAQILTDAAEDSHAGATAGPGIAPALHGKRATARVRLVAAFGVIAFALALLVHRRSRDE